MAALSLQTNVASLRGQRHMRRIGGQLAKAATRLSSGFAINSARDNAAGLGISEGLRAQVRGLAQATRNANDAISVIQSAEGIMAEMSDMMIRMRELAVHAASDTVTNTERDYMQTEFKEMVLEVDHLANSTKFNGVLLLDGSYQNKTFMVAATGTTGSENSIKLSINSMTAIGLKIWGESISDKKKALGSMVRLDEAIKYSNENRALLGAKANRLTHAANATQVMRENLSATNSRIRDANVAEESSDFARNKVLMNAAASMLGQANALPQLALRLLG